MDFLKITFLKIIFKTIIFNINSISYEYFFNNKIIILHFLEIKFFLNTFKVQKTRKICKFFKRLFEKKTNLIFQRTKKFFSMYVQRTKKVIFK